MGKGTARGGDSCPSVYELAAGDCFTGRTLGGWWARAGESQSSARHSKKYVPLAPMLCLGDSGEPF